jgi:hypothetical protein
MTNERALVAAGPKAFRRLWWRGTASLFVAAVALVVITTTDDAATELACATVLGFLVGISAHKPLSRAMSYRRGWLDGRNELLMSMAEAHKRDLSADQWINSERERTVYVTGRDIPEGEA